MRLRLAAAIIIMAVMAAMIASIVPLVDKTWDKAGQWRAYTMESAINRALSQCFALEGAYPPDLDYLELNYYIALDEERYLYHYQYNGGNLRPEIWVVER